MDKRRFTGGLAKYVVNPVTSRLAGRLPWYALLETRGRKTGRARRTPVGDGLRGDVFWLVSDHGYASAYVRNIQADPRVRIRTHGRWRSGVATPLPDDDPRARQRVLGLGANAVFVRIVGTTLLTVRIDLELPDGIPREREPDRPSAAPKPRVAGPRDGFGPAVHLELGKDR